MNGKAKNRHEAVQRTDRSSFRQNRWIRMLQTNDSAKELNIKVPKIKFISISCQPYSSFGFPA